MSSSAQQWDPTPSSGAEQVPAHDDGVGSSRGRPRTRRQGRAARVVTVALTVLLLAALGTAGYLWRTTLAWEDHAQQWQDEAQSYADQVADLQDELDGVTAELVAAREQLDTATARITALADEKAQLGDDNVASQQYLDYQRRVSEAAGVVATALGQCTAAQSQLIGYLDNREAYEPDDLDRFASDVQALCDEANDANEQLQQELAE